MQHLSAKFWWILVFRGLLGVGLAVLCGIWLVQIHQPYLDNFGLLTFLRQAVIVEMVVTLLACYAFMDGFFALVLGMQNYGEGRRWWSLAAEGLLSLALGFLVFFRPGVTIWVLFYWVVFWAVFTGILELMQSFDLREYKDRKRPYFLIGLTSMLFGLLLVLNSERGGEALIWVLGGYALVFGGLLLQEGLHLRRYSHEWTQWKKSYVKIKG